ncbi:MAG: hypothetical protein ACE5EW_02315 [Thermoplasmata archaeon]
MESGGEVQSSVLRVGGLAGILTGVLVVAAIITFVAAMPSFTFPPDLATDLERFPENGTILRAGFSIQVVALLLLLPFLAAFYWSLREPSRVFARIGLGSGVLAVILAILGFQGNLQSTHIFSVVLEDFPADRAVVVATYAAVQSLVAAVNVMSFLFLGLTFAAFGLAMRANPAYSEGFAWLTVILGVLIVLFPLPLLGLISILLFIVLAVVLGWKVYSLAGAA